MILAHFKPTYRHRKEVKMDAKLKLKIAFIVFPCNWDGDFHRCKGFCSDHMKQVCQKKVDDICKAIDEAQKEGM